MTDNNSPSSSTNANSEDLFTVGGAVDRIRISLRVIGDDLDPDEVTRLLQCQPSRAYRKGDIIPAPYKRIAHTGVWKLEGQEPEIYNLDEQLNTLLASVTSNLEVWKNLTNRYNANIFCGLFLGDFNRELALSPQSMKALADRGIYIDFDIYCQC